MGYNPKGLRWLTFMFQKAYLGPFFLALVMFSGALPDGNRARRKLLSIRGEPSVMSFMPSVMSFIFYLGHIANYLMGYLPMLSNLAVIKPGVALSLGAAGVLTATFVILGVTSFKTVRTCMDSKAWALLQKGAYVMVALLAAHVALALWLFLTNLGSTGSQRCIVCLAVVAAYAAMRTSKAVRLRRRA